MSKIDIVYTWVNGNDRLWNDKKNSYLKNSNVYKNSLDEQAGSQRFTDNNELKYSLRSIELFAPWVNHIYIVTDNQIPEWLNEQENVTIIDHKEIIPEEYLPTFNSSVIEAHLHNITTLQEMFIYFNDDMFLGKKTVKHDFFKHGKPNIFTSSIFPVKKKEPKFSTYNTQAIVDSRNIVKSKIRKEVNYGIKHGIKPLLKSRLKLIAQQYSMFLTPYYNEKFRLTPFSLLYIYTFNEIALRNANTKYLKTLRLRSRLYLKLFPTFCYIKDSNIKKFSDNYEKISPFVFCVNEISINLEKIHLFSHGKLSKKSKFEI
ncbi:stealth family protein [Vibrio rumoiensis]|uniref:stealth family protein n=1 Tax=Vibrio rumoiensis TaxID=76258 RepID=UPI003AA83ED6